MGCSGCLFIEKNQNELKQETGRNKPKQINFEKNKIQKLVNINNIENAKKINNPKDQADKLKQINNLDKEKSLKKDITNNDKKIIKEYKEENEIVNLIDSKNPKNQININNIIRINFNFEGINVTVQASIKERFKNIINKFVIKTQLNLENLIFLYCGKQLEPEKIVKEQISELDKIRKEMTILVDRPSVNPYFIKIKFIFRNTIIEIEASLKDNFEDAIDKFFKKSQIMPGTASFFANNKILKPNLTIENQINNVDIIKNEIKVFVLKLNMNDIICYEHKDINMFSSYNIAFFIVLPKTGKKNFKGG